MPRFLNVSCSNCGRDFGPGNAGYSHCWQHRSLSDPRLSPAQRRIVATRRRDDRIKCEAA